jgi:8-oxo-dGTP diphosphatase
VGSFYIKKEIAFIAAKNHRIHRYLENRSGGIMEGNKMCSEQQRFSFCPKCGGRLGYSRTGERKRLVCVDCGYIMYENPIVGVAAIVVEGDKILLGRRAVGATYSGLWCIPCGYVEYDEDVRDAIRREFLEETGLVIELDGVFTVLSNWHNPDVHTVGVWFRARAVGGTIQPGDDIDAVDYFSLKAPPPLAFPTDERVLEALLAADFPCGDR